VDKVEEVLEIALMKSKVDDPMVFSFPKESENSRQIA
jgi:ATP-dependent Lon protease